MGPRITQMLYIVVYGFPFQLTDQYFQSGGFLHWVTFLVETPLISMDCYIVLSIVLSLDIWNQQESKFKRLRFEISYNLLTGKTGVIYNPLTNWGGTKYFDDIYWTCFQVFAFRQFWDCYNWGELSYWRFGEPQGCWGPLSILDLKWSWELLQQTIKIDTRHYRTMFDGSHNIHMHICAYMYIYIFSTIHGGLFEVACQTSTCISNQF